MLGLTTLTTQTHPVFHISPSRPKDSSKCDVIGVPQDLSGAC